MIGGMTGDPTAADFLAQRVGAFPEARVVGLGIDDPLLSQYRATWNSQSPDWQAQMGELFLSQPDAWVLAMLTSLPAPLAVKGVGFIGPNPPALPTKDTLWYDDINETWKRYNGTIWISQTGSQSGVATVNGQAGTVTITAAGLGAIPTATLGVTGGTAQLDNTGVVPAAQSRVSSVAGRTGAITLTVADVTNAVSTASIGVSSGVASLDATGHIPLAQIPAGIGGGGGGGAVSSVAGRTGVITLSVTDVTNAAAIDPSTGKLQFTLVPQKFAASLLQPGTASVGSLFPGGYPSPYPTTLAYAVITTSRAPIGSGTSVLLRSRLHSSQAFTTLATVPIPSGIRRVVTPLSQVINAWDTLHASVTGLGSTEGGGDIVVTYVGVGAVAPPGILSAPTAPTGLAVAATSSTSNTVSWAAPVSGLVTTYHLYRSDTVNPLAWIGNVDSTTTSFLDTGLTSGVAYTYEVIASNEDQAGPPATSTPSGFTYFSQSAGSLSSSSWITRLGTSTGTTSTVDAFGNWNVSSGNGGANTPQDQVLAQWSETGNPTYSAIRVIMHIKWGHSADLMNIFFSSNAFATAIASWTQGIEIQMQPGNYRVGLKSPTYTPPSQSIGSFYNITTDTAAQATTHNSTGQPAWTLGTMALNTEYIFTAELLAWSSGGPQTMNIYLSTLGGSPVLQNTITINSTQRAAIATGYLTFGFLGNQITAGQTSIYTMPSPLQIIPLTAANT